MLSENQLDRSLREKREEWEPDEAEELATYPITAEYEY